MKLRVESIYFKGELESTGKDDPVWACSAMVRYMFNWPLEKIVKHCIRMKWNLELIP